jgi:hypothetical protein
MIKKRQFSKPGRIGVTVWNFLDFGFVSFVSGFEIGILGLLAGAFGYRPFA